MSDDIKLIGIVGAGQMGLGIAQVLATSGFNVLINDRDQIRKILKKSEADQSDTNKSGSVEKSIIDKIRK